MQTYRSLGAKGWVTCLFQEWRTVDTQALLEHLPLCFHK